MVPEVISGVKRRRHWPTAAKLGILSEALAPGAPRLRAELPVARTDHLPGISVSPQAGQFHSCSHRTA